jgi:hypothetical protein
MKKYDNVLMLSTTQLLARVQVAPARSSPPLLFPFQPARLQIKPSGTHLPLEAVILAPLLSDLLPVASCDLAVDVVEARLEGGRLGLLGLECHGRGLEPLDG